MAKLFEIGAVENLNDINTNMVRINIDYVIQQQLRNVTSVQCQSCAGARITRLWHAVTADLWAAP